MPKLRCFSKLAGSFKPLPINALAEAVKDKMLTTKGIINFTIGDFSPKHFPIPKELKSELTKAYRSSCTNYPTVSGMKKLREAIAHHLKIQGKYDYQPNEIMVASGSRPLIYLLYKALIDPKDRVIYTTPSWNNEQFVKLARATPIVIRTTAKNNFLPTYADLKPHLSQATMIMLNIPSNPTGTSFEPESLKKILSSIVKENKKRLSSNHKPLYLCLDLVYWLISYQQPLLNPILLCPEIRKYIVFIDGISKCFAATGLRIGWAFGPSSLIEKMSLLNSYLGAWPAKPSQVALTNYLYQQDNITDYLTKLKSSLAERIKILASKLLTLKARGYKIEVIKPYGAIYLAVKLDLIGLRTKEGLKINTTDNIKDYLLQSAKVAIIPFYLFGTPKQLPWFRLAVSGCSINEATTAAANLVEAITKLS